MSKSKQTTEGGEEIKRGEHLAIFTFLEWKKLVIGQSYYK